MTAPIDRARQLVDLATNEGASPHEAASAALAAARLIKAHGLLDGATPGPAARVAVSGVVDFDRIVADHRRRWAAEDAAQVARAGVRPPIYQPDTTAEAEAKRSWEEAKRAKGTAAKRAPVRDASKRRGDS